MPFYSRQVVVRAKTITSCYHTMNAVFASSNPILTSFYTILEPCLSRPKYSFPRLNWCMTIQPCPHPFERLPPELCIAICSIIHDSQEWPREYHTTFLALSLVSRRCRLYTAPYMFIKVFLRESCFADSATSLENCISTRGHLCVLSNTTEIDVVIPVAGGKCAWEYERENAVRLLQSFPNLRKLYIRTGEELTAGLVDEVQQVVMNCCSSGGKTFGHYWWWYSMDSQSEGRIHGDEKLVTRSNCRMVRLFRRGKRRPPFVCSYQDIQGYHTTRGIVVSSHLTYLFMLV